MAPHAVILGSGGIGSAIAHFLNDQGWSLSLVGRPGGSLDALSASIPQAEAHSLDVTDWSSIESLASGLKVTQGHIAYINAIGTVLLKPAHRTSMTEWQDLISANLTTAFLTVKLAATVGKPGAVLLFSSAAAQLGLQNHEAIAAAKAGVEGLTRSAATTYANKNIRVNALAPGLVDTPLAEPITSRPAMRQASEAMHALGRIGTAEQIAHVAAQMVDPATDWLTGAVWSLDGGLAHCRR